MTERPSVNLPLCCIEAEDPPCDQHRQQARVVRHQGPRNRSAGGSRVIGESGKARPVRDTEEQR